MRARDVAHAPSQASPGPAVVLVTVDAMAIVVLTTLAVLMAVIVFVFVLVVVMRAARAVHDIQHARVNALPHIDNYQGRALAN